MFDAVKVKFILCFFYYYYLTQERNMAAEKIQLLVRTFLQKRRGVRQNRAAVLLQSVWRGHAARNRLRLQREAQVRALQSEAATVIQVGFCNISNLFPSN